MRSQDLDSCIEDLIHASLASANPPMRVRTSIPAAEVGGAGQTPLQVCLDVPSIVGLCYIPR